MVWVEIFSSYIYNGRYLAASGPFLLWKSTHVEMPWRFIGGLAKLGLHSFVPGIWASYQIRKIAGCACAGNVGNGFPGTDFKGNH